MLLLALVFTSALLLKQQGYSKEIPLNFQRQDSTIIGPGKMELKIWDYSIVDSDLVNIIFNGKPIFKNLLLSDTPVIYKTGFLNRGRYWIGVEGMSEGFVASGSTHIALTNGKQNFEFNIDAYIGKHAKRPRFAPLFYHLTQCMNKRKPIPSFRLNTLSY